MLRHPVLFYLVALNRSSYAVSRMLLELCGVGAVLVVDARPTAPASRCVCVCACVFGCVCVALHVGVCMIV